MSNTHRLGRNFLTVDWSLLKCGRCMVTPKPSAILTIVLQFLWNIAQLSPASWTGSESGNYRTVTVVPDLVAVGTSEQSSLLQGEHSEATG